MDIKVSIVTPCFNSAKTISDTFNSIMEQTYRNIEYIIIDGGSTDRTMDIVHNYENRFHIPIRVISEKDNGIYDAMNKGIKIASGNIIGIVNSDDWYEPDTVENVVRSYQGNKYEVVYGMKRVIERGKEKAIDFKHHDFLHEQMICHPTCFVTHSVYKDFGAFDIKYKSSADYDFMLRIFDSGKVTFTPVYKILSNFRTGGMSYSQKAFRETLSIKMKYGDINRKSYYSKLLRSYLYDLLH